MSTPRRLLVFGAGGHGKVVADAGRAAGLQLAGFLDDGAPAARSGPLGLPVIPWTDFLSRRDDWADAAVALGLGDNRAREACAARLAAVGLEIATLVHPSAVVAPSAVLGPGTVVAAGAAVNPDARIGAGVIVNTGAVVEHDCVVGRYAHLSPNATLGGTVRIGDRTHLGLGAVVLPGLSIGADVRVGAGAAVIQDLPAGVTAVGVPARIARKERK